MFGYSLQLFETHFNVFVVSFSTVGLTLQIITMLAFPLNVDFSILVNLDFEYRPNVSSLPSSTMASQKYFMLSSVHVPHSALISAPSDRSKSTKFK